MGIFHRVVYHLPVGIGMEILRAATATAASLTITGRRPSKWIISL